MKHLIYLIFLCAVVGCSQGTLITGTVHFDDGTPVTKGSVVFDSAKESFFGTISSEGNYTTGRNKEKQGIPDGNYTVWLSETEKIENKRDDKGLTIGGSITQLVAPEFRSPSKSPLRFEVKKGVTKTFDIVVERNKTGK